MKGYNLNKTGERVSELLSRQFIVPTLQEVPTENTLSWIDGEYNTQFRIGEFCRVKVDEEYQFYQLQDIKDNKAYWVNTSNSSSSGDVDLSDYYTKEEVNDKIDNIEFPEDESIKIVSQEEYDVLVENNNILPTTIYFITLNEDPVALYLGKVLIAQREEGQKGFTYNFPIIF